jgi:hypothetical protein
MLPYGFREFGTEKNIVAKVIDSWEQAFEDECRLVARQRELPGMI